MIRQHLQPSEAVADIHMLGQVAWDDCWRLQQRLMFEISGESRPHIVVLLCEHPPTITIGRSGSRGHIHLRAEELERLQLPIHWLNRGGGCILHAPGQLAVYPIVPLDSFAWTPGEYLRRLQSAVITTLEHLQVRPRTRGGSLGIWGRTGLLAAIGISVQHSTTSQGAFINVAPGMAPFGHVVTSAGRGADREQETMSCLLAERRLPVRMTSVRTALITSLLQAFDCERHNIHTGHPWLNQLIGPAREFAFRAD